MDRAEAIMKKEKKQKIYTMILMREQVLGWVGGWGGSGYLQAGGRGPIVSEL